MFDQLQAIDPRSVSQTKFAIVLRLPPMSNERPWPPEGTENLLTLVRTSCTLVTGTHQSSLKEVSRCPACSVARQ